MKGTLVFLFHPPNSILSFIKSQTHLKKYTIFHSISFQSHKSTHSIPFFNYLPNIVLLSSKLQGQNNSQSTIRLWSIFLYKPLCWFGHSGGKNIRSVPMLQLRRRLYTKEMLDTRRHQTNQEKSQTWDISTQFQQNMRQAFNN